MPPRFSTRAYEHAPRRSPSEQQPSHGEHQTHATQHPGRYSYLEPCRNLSETDQREINASDSEEQANKNPMAAICGSPDSHIDLVDFFYPLLDVSPPLAVRGLRTPIEF